MQRDLKLARIRHLWTTVHPAAKPVVFDEDNACTNALDEEAWIIHRKRAWTVVCSGGHYDMIDFSVQAAGGAPAVITSANKGADQNPVYSPDGRFIAYASQARAGFESDRWRLMIYSRADRTSRERFQEAFQVINQHFGEIFRQLFGAVEIVTGLLIIAT